VSAFPNAKSSEDREDRRPKSEDQTSHVKHHHSSVPNLATSWSVSSLFLHNLLIITKTYSSKQHSKTMSSKTTAPALDQKKAIFYMFLLALQFGMQPTLTRRFTPEGITRSTVILMQEVLKFVLACTMLNLSGSTKSALTGKKIFGWPRMHRRSIVSFDD
jgi:hypothetical protein